MFRPYSFSLSFSGLLALGCAATGGEDAPTASSRDYDDVAMALTESTVNPSAGGAAETLFDATTLATGAAAGVIVNQPAGGFEGERGGLSYAYTVECTDADGSVMERCNFSTDTAHVNANVGGSLETFGFTAVVSHESDLTLSKLTSGRVHVSGSGDFEIDATYETAARRRIYHLGYSVVYDDVQVSRSALEVIGGRIELVVDAERHVMTEDGNDTGTTKTFRMHGEIAFASDGSAMLTLDDEHRYTVDMHTGQLFKYE